jgi:hypothetical protein
VFCVENSEIPNAFVSINVFFKVSNTKVCVLTTQKLSLSVVFIILHNEKSVHAPNRPDRFFFRITFRGPMWIKGFNELKPIQKLKMCYAFVFTFFNISWTLFCFLHTNFYRVCLHKICLFFAFYIYIYKFRRSNGYEQKQNKICITRWVRERKRGTQF